MTIASPFVVRDGSVKIATIEYGSIITKARLVPAVNIQTFSPLVPAGAVVDTGSPTWTLELTMGEDWTATTGLSAILFGDTTDQTVLAVVLAADVTTGKPNMSFNIVAIPSPYSAIGGEFNSSDLVFPVIGQPTAGVQA